MSSDSATTRISDADQRPIRLRQLVGSSGPGAVVRIGMESFVVCDSSHWTDSQGVPTGRPIDLPRLATSLGVGGLYEPPMESDEERNRRARLHRDRSWETRIACLRFPRWLICQAPTCRRIWRWGWTDEHSGSDARLGEREWSELCGAQRLQDPAPTCPNCRREGRKSFLIPYPKALVCANGHISDLPINWLVHEFGSAPGNPPRCEHRNLLREDWTEEGIAGRVFECEACRRRLRESTILDRLDPLRWAELPEGEGPIRLRCRGEHPWDATRDESCDCFLGGRRERSEQVDQRLQVVDVIDETSLVYTPANRQAIDIPPHAFEAVPLVNLDLSLENQPEWADLRSGLQTQGRAFLEGRAARRLLRDMERRTGVAESTILDQLIDASSDRTRRHDSVERSDQELRNEEYNAFLEAPIAPDPDSSRFIVRAVDLSHWSGSEEADPLGDVAVVRRVDRLRMVHVLRGFSRLGEVSVNDGDSNRVVPPHVHHRLDWLPASEVFGEGIFLALNEASVQAWERDHPEFISERLADIFTPLERVNAIPWRQEVDPPRLPRFVLLHTLSHLLQRQLAFESGYPSTSIGEVVYASTFEDRPMAGILIFATEADERGGMGGLSRLAEPDRLRSIVGTALQRAKWCSNDPVCAKRTRQGPRRMNRAACHSCATVPEFSCTHENEYLDRLLLVDRRAGFFREFLEASAKGGGK